MVAFDEVVGTSTSVIFVGLVSSASDAVVRIFVKSVAVDVMFSVWYMFGSHVIPPVAVDACRVWINLNQQCTEKIDNRNIT